MADQYAYPYTFVGISGRLTDNQANAGLGHDLRGADVIRSGNTVTVRGTAIPMANITQKVVSLIDDFPTVDIDRTTVGSEATRHLDGRQDCTIELVYQVDDEDALGTKEQLHQNPGGRRYFFCELNGSFLCVLCTMFPGAKQNTPDWQQACTLRNYNSKPAAWADLA